MAFGVESRVPYLDYRLVQFLFSTADHAKIHDARMKILLRKVGEGTIPESITSRDDKIGFYTPMADWLAKSPQLIHDALSTEFAHENRFINFREFSKVCEAFLSGRTGLAGIVWRGLSLCLWHHMFVQEYRSFSSYLPETLHTSTVG